MSDNTSNDRQTESEPTTSLGRRRFFAASGLAGVVAVTGPGAASSSNRTDGRRRGQNRSGFTRHELSDDGFGNAQTDTPPFSPRLVTHDATTAADR